MAASRHPGPVRRGSFRSRIEEFLNKKEALADYFDDAQTENIFAYIPQQKTSLVFTPQPVVKLMVDRLESENGVLRPRADIADLFNRRIVPDGTRA